MDILEKAIKRCWRILRIQHVFQYLCHTECVIERAINCIRVGTNKMFPFTLITKAS